MRSTFQAACPAGHHEVFVPDHVEEPVLGKAAAMTLIHAESRRDVVDHLNRRVIGNVVSGPSNIQTEGHFPVNLRALTAKPRLEANLPEKTPADRCIAALEEIHPPGRSMPFVVIAKNSPVGSENSNRPGCLFSFAHGGVILEEISATKKPESGVSFEMHLNPLDPIGERLRVIVEQADDFSLRSQAGGRHGGDDARFGCLRDLDLPVRPCLAGEEGVSFRVPLAGAYHDLIWRALLPVKTCEGFGKEFRAPVSGCEDGDAHRAHKPKRGGWRSGGNDFQKELRGPRRFFEIQPGRRAMAVKYSKAKVAEARTLQGESGFPRKRERITSAMCRGRSMAMSRGLAP